MADPGTSSDVDEAARFWGEGAGPPVDANHPSSRGNYRMLETPPDELIVEIQRATSAAISSVSMSI